MKQPPEHLLKYIDYINNTAQVPLSTDAFDEDWEPVGSMVRRDLERGGFIHMGGCFYQKPGIYLRPDLQRQQGTPTE